jgi:hypothetical protein
MSWLFQGKEQSAERFVSMSPVGPGAVFLRISTIKALCSAYEGVLNCRAFGHLEPPR